MCIVWVWLKPCRLYVIQGTLLRWVAALGVVALVCVVIVLVLGAVVVWSGMVLVCG